VREKAVREEVTRRTGAVASRARVACTLTLRQEFVLVRRVEHDHARDGRRVTSCHAQVHVPPTSTFVQVGVEGSLDRVVDLSTTTPTVTIKATSAAT
jgi:hypothetical protein